VRIGLKLYIESAMTFNRRTLISTLVVTYVTRFQTQMIKAARTLKKCFLAATNSKWNPF